MSELTTWPARPALRTRDYPVFRVRDYAVMIARCLRLSTRELDALVTSIFLPVMLMVVFVYLFGGAVHVGTSYVTYVVPGVLVLCAGTGSAMTAVPVCRDVAAGITDRFRSMDVGGLAILTGHVAASALRNVVSTILVFGVALAIGFRPHAGLAAWAAVAGLLLLWVLAVSWLAAAFGLAMSSPEAANTFMFVPMIFTYASSGFVPVRTMPVWLHGFADHQPATPVIETLRGLLLGHPVQATVGPAVAWSAGLLVVSVALAALAFRRRAH